MENRDRDKVSRNSSSTPSGDVNRETSSRQGRVDSDSSASFGEKIGRSESQGIEPSRRSGSDDDTLPLNRERSSSSDRSSSSNRSEH